MGDATEAAFQRKLHRKRNEICELHAEGVSSRPMVWTADGRPHPPAVSILQVTAEKASRRSPAALRAKFRLPVHDEERP